MRSVVVCESWFGNTEQVARAIASELARHGEAEVVHVDEEISALETIDLLVVGAPTHVHGMSSSMSRKAAIEQSGLTVEAGPGARGWLEQLQDRPGAKAAAFDTRIEKSPMLTGAAAKGIAKRLRQHGFELVAEPESFFVLDTAGPLKEGELERAGYWAAGLAELVMRAKELVSA